MKRVEVGACALVTGLRRALLPALLPLAMLLSPAAAQAQADAPAASAEAAPAKKRPRVKDECLKCHDDAALKTAEGKTLSPMAEVFNQSAHKKTDCGRCHASAFTVSGHGKEPLQAGRLGPVDPAVCKECHEEEIAAIADSRHGENSASEKAIKDCTGCHGNLHAVKKEGDPTSPVSATNQLQACGSCHKEAVEAFSKSEHARNLLTSGGEKKAGKDAPTCTSCHGKHDIRSKGQLASLVHKSKQPETCGECHDKVLAEWTGSVHGKLWKTGNPGTATEGPTCADCHGPHAIGDVDAAAVRAQLSDGCAKCHSEVTASFHDSFHGKATRLNNRKAADCSDCHTAHNNLPKSDPASSIHPANLVKTCGACHQGANASFVTFDPHARPESPDRNPYVHWVYLGMTGLLLGVFSAFGIHGLLWFQRSLVALLRGEIHSHANHDGPYVRRFNGMQVAIHITIVVSFLVLSITGLPLKFADSTWAPGLMRLVGGAESAGYLHRVAGVITFGYFAWHLGSLVYQWFVQKDRTIFWGPRSMVPQPRDIVDAFKMIKYFLYLGPRPKFDRFTYWEKFDYLAVFWGVAIIGGSGLVLWFPTFFTTFLPGWALNAAYVVHSDEALLATGFIFLFHFFHTHLRPEAFPMDLVIFLGRMPLATLKDERPLEYERLVASGQLESRLGPKPSPTEFRVAYTIGTIALLTGLACAVFIFRALLQMVMH